ncbi:MAG: hypothetical protein ACM3JB_24285 [Acidobacteriaceae bacterium]
MGSVLVPIFALILLFLAVLGIVIGGMWLLRRLLGKSPEEQSAEASRLERARLLRPQWPDLQDHFHTPIPKIVQDIYADETLITMQDLQVRGADGKEWKIAKFLPADLETLSETWSELRVSPVLPIASAPQKDVFYIALDGKSYEVKLFHHAAGDHELIASSVVDFLAGLDRGMRY